MFLDPPALGGGRDGSSHVSHGPGFGPAGMYGPGAYGERDPQDGDGVEVPNPPPIKKPTKPKQPPLHVLLAEIERWVLQADRAGGDCEREEALSLTLAVLCGLFKKMLLSKKQVVYCVRELERIKRLPDNRLLSDVWERKGFDPFERALASLKS